MSYFIAKMHQIRFRCRGGIDIPDSCLKCLPLKNSLYKIVVVANEAVITINGFTLAEESYCMLQLK